MKIGIDASRLTRGMSGIGRYIWSIFNPLDQMLPDAQFVIYARANFQFELPSSRWSVSNDPHPVLRKLPIALWIRYRLGALARQDNLDVFWAANTLMPLYLGSLPCVVTVYDLNHLLFPETMQRLTRWAHRRWFADAVIRATRVVAISEGTSSRLKASLGRRADAIALPSITLPWPPPSHEDALKLIQALGVNKPFLLTVGTCEPRKNLAGVVAAVSDMKSAGQLHHYRLIMVGATGWGKFLGHELQKAEWLHPVGYVNDDTLAALYTMADAFIFPSIYEGYGIPVSEAIAFGCRVVATDLPELRESGSPDVIYIEPTPPSIAHGLDAALASPPTGPKAPSHDWFKAAFNMAAMLKEAANLAEKNI